DHSQFFDEWRIEGDFVQAIQDVACGFRCAGPMDWIDLYQNRVARIALANERSNGRVAGVAAVPIGLPVNFNCLVHRREARGCEQCVDGELRITEYSPASRLDIGRSNEDPDRRFPQATEIDAFSQDVAQGIESSQSEVVGREHA